MTTRITTENILDNTIKNADISCSAAIAASKLVVCTAQQDTNAYNISLLGFKMAVNEGLTVFNLVDGVVDEFHDESGTDEAEGSNDTYCATTDCYQNATAPVSACYSAGFAIASVTEPGPSTAGTNPGQEVGSPGTFTVPSGMTSMVAKLWGAGGGGGFGQGGTQEGGGGGFATGTVGVSPGQTIYTVTGELGLGTGSPKAGFGGDHPADSGTTAGNRRGGGIAGHQGGGGGLAYVGTAVVDQERGPAIMLIAGGGGGGGGHAAGAAGAGGGATGQDGSGQAAGEGGSQTAGGESSGPQAAQGDGGFLYGGDRVPTQGGAGGGAGYYGGGGGGFDGSGAHGSSGGGSSYFGHPQVTSGSTEGGAGAAGGGTGDPAYVASTNEGGPSTPKSSGEDGYVLLTGSGTTAGTTATSVIVSEAFASKSVATSARVVVFEEDVATPTLNTDIIASVSRDGGSTFTTATLTDSGYVTGSSGQRILTGQATISGQPSGQSMRWKLNLANNKVKIHGVSLQWA